MKTNLFTINLLFVVLLSLFLNTSVFSQVKNAGCYLRMVEPENSELFMENDSVKISFTFNDWNYFCNINVENKTNDVISIDWDKFILILESESHKILFDDTILLNKHEPKGKSSIAPKTSLSKNIAAIEYIDLEMPLYNKRWIKKHGSQEIDFIIPIYFGEQIKNYNCKISVSIN